MIRGPYQVIRSIYSLHRTRKSLSGKKEPTNLDRGAGNDGLFGGVEPDILFGGAGADRFLVNVENLSFAWSFRGDRLIDVADEDAMVRFHDAGCSWSDEEIAAVDEAFSLLVRATGNTRLLKLSRTPLGDDRILDFYRQGDHYGVAMGDNDSRGDINIYQEAIGDPNIVAKKLDLIGNFVQWLR